MKKHHNRTFYVCFCFIILFTNSCKAQSKNDINNFFKKEKKDAYNYCLNSLEKDEEYLYAKSKNYIDYMKLGHDNCERIANNYDIYKSNSLDLIDKNLDNDKDFIIININLKRIDNIRVDPILTIMKFKDENNYHILHCNYIYDRIKEKYYWRKDTDMAEYNAENNFIILENYLYNGFSNNKIIKEINVTQEFEKSFRTYYIIARVSGKIITKKIYFADDYNNQ